MPKQCCENCSDSKGGCYNNRAIDNSCPCHKPMPIHCVICKKELNGYENHLTYHKPMPISKQTIHEEYKARYDDFIGSAHWYDSVKSFYDTKIKELLDQIVPKGINNYSPTKGRLTYSHPEDDKLMKILEVAEEMGVDPHNLIAVHNQAINEIRENIKKLGYEK